MGRSDGRLVVGLAVDVRLRIAFGCRLRCRSRMGADGAPVFGRGAGMGRGVGVLMRIARGVMTWGSGPHVQVCDISVYSREIRERANR